MAPPGKGSLFAVLLTTPVGCFTFLGLLALAFFLVGHYGLTLLGLGVAGSAAYLRTLHENHRRNPAYIMVILVGLAIAIWPLISPGR